MDVHIKLFVSLPTAVKTAALYAIALFRRKQHEEEGIELHVCM
jgi:hypothetical protein